MSVMVAISHMLAAQPEPALLIRIVRYAALFAFLIAFIAWGHNLTKYYRAFRTAATQHLAPGAKLSAGDQLSLMLMVRDPNWLAQHTTAEAAPLLEAATYHRQRAIAAAMGCLLMGGSIWLLKGAV